ncbi:serine hydrolase [Lacibacter sp. MH-610]|uniref:serine hydrolase domain-containing protein n=1 Tax=Lacibacter sp. MH-610 TaxID=3020883 RepID=UPI003892970A
MKQLNFLIAALLLLISCKKSTEEPAPTPTTPAVPVMYFPPVSGTTWETTDPASLKWNTTELNNLYTYLVSKNTKAFIILKDGKLVAERYFGTFTADSIWYWASAGKTMTGMLVGIAQQEGLLNINNKTSQYLGNGWTSMPQAKEDLITVRNQLTMTTGLENNVPDDDCTLPSCLQYKADAGTRWFYHNAPYTLLDKVVENASGQTYNAYFQNKIRNRIGMNGLWIKNGYNNIYYSNTRSMARFGLLMLNKGKWDGTAILADTNYFNAQVNTSQNLNLSYGYLTWLNGKATHMLPATSHVFNGSFAPNAPADMYAALGKNDQKIYVVPSQRLVVIRMGESAGNVQLAVSSFDNELWGKLKAVIRY